MFRYLAILFLFIHSAATAQVMDGTVLNMYSQTTMAGISIYNKRSGVVSHSDEDGRFAINAEGGDTVIFKQLSYRQVAEVMTFGTGNRHTTILMPPEAYQLKAVTVTGKTKYQQDSTEKHELYTHDLHKEAVPPPQYTGLGCAGCIGWLADKITGNSKALKAFKKQFAEDERSLFIDSRYYPALVSRLTNINDTDSVARFIYQYPMAYDFSRSATDLEIKVWIRENYHLYMKMEIVKRE